MAFDGLAGGFCPDLHEDGTNPNNLRSITEKTRVGDFCSSTQIAAGEVIFNGIIRGRAEYACTCMATACRPGFSFNNGVKIANGTCQTIIANEKGQCLREEHEKSSQNDTTQKCKDFCAARYDGKGCSFTSIVMQHSTGKCICNANQNEIADAKDSMEKAQKKAEEQRLANLPYYQVCGKDKGQGVCVNDVFNWTNTSINSAIGLAQEYARSKGHAIICNRTHRSSGNDDYSPEMSKDLRAIESVHNNYISDLEKNVSELRDTQRNIKPFEDDVQNQINNLNKQIRSVNKELEQTTGEMFPNPETVQNNPHANELYEQSKRLYSQRDELTELNHTDEYNLINNRLNYQNALLEDAKRVQQADKNKIVNKYISEDILEDVAKQRHDDYIKIVGSDDELYRQSQNFESMSMQDRELHMQKIVDKMEEMYLDENVKYSPTVRFYEDPNPKHGANAMFQVNNNFEGLDNYDGMSEITKHEFSHRITGQNPNRGALGTQAAHESGIGNYINHTDENGLPIKDFDNSKLYRENTDEISSFFIGEYENANTANQIRQWRIQNGLKP